MCNVHIIPTYILYESTNKFNLYIGRYIIIDMIECGIISLMLFKKWSDIFLKYTTDAL